MAIGLMLAGGALVGPVAWQAQKDRTAYHRYGQGHITAGGRFGVSVGIPWADADAAIRRQFSPAYVLWQTGTPEQLERGGGHSPGGPVMSGEARVSYRDEARGNGVVTLFLRDGCVTGIGWSYTPNSWDF